MFCQQHFIRYRLQDCMQDLSSGGGKLGQFKFADITFTLLNHVFSMSTNVLRDYSPLLPPLRNSLIDWYLLDRPADSQCFCFKLVHAH